jgi:hypothetical protein
VSCKPEHSNPVIPINGRQGPVRCMIDAERRTVFVKFVDKLSLRDLESYVRRLEQDPRFEPDFSEITDIRDVQIIDLSAEDMMKVASQTDPFSARAYRAFVVRTPTQAHAARMHKILLSRKNFEIFESVEDAEQWLAQQTSSS